MNIENTIKEISIESLKYSNILKQIYDPPKKLYVMGDEKLLNVTSIAIVGSRDNTEYGKKASKYFAYNLAKQNICIVSGLAKGIDSFAHIGALYAKGKTIAVDPDVISYGSKVLIGDTVYIAEDCGTDVKGDHIDIFMEDHEATKKFGVKYTHVDIIQGDYEY